MPQPLKFRTDVDTGPMEAGMKRVVKLGADAAALLDKHLAQLDKNTGSRLAKLATAFSNPYAAVGKVALEGFAIGEQLGKNIAAGVGRAFEAGKAIQQLHRATGGNVAGLVILQDKFRKAGLEGEKVATSIFRLQKSIAGVEDEENKGGSKALAGLGLNLANLRKYSPDQQLFAVGRAISQIADPAQRTATAMQIFGKSGAELGAVFSGSDFSRISPELQRKADMMARNSDAFERAARSIARVESLVQASANTFYAGTAEGLVQGLQPLLDDFKSVDLSGMGKNFGKALGDGATAIHAMLAELEASGIVKLGEKLIAGATKTVGTTGAIIGDAVKVSGGGQSGALMAAGGWMAGALLDRVNEKLDSMHATAALPDTIQARFARRHIENVADFYNNPANPGVAGTDHRPESRAANNRPETLPKYGPVTLPDPAKRLAPSAPGGEYTPDELEEIQYRRQHAVASSHGSPPVAVAPGREVIAGGDLTYLARMHLANSGINPRGMNPDAIGAAVASRVFSPGGDNTSYFNRVATTQWTSFAASHAFGRTALDFDPSLRPGWTGAKNATEGFRRGLSGGAYGATVNIMTQISGRVGGSGDPHLDALKGIHDKIDELVKTWKGGDGGSGGGGGATLTR